LLAKIDSVVEAARKARSIPGVAIAVVRGNDTVALKGYGMANLENDVPVGPETVFHLASISKQFTAAGILKLVEQGRVKLEDDLTIFVPDYVTNGRRVSIHHLLAHTHGMQEYNRPETRDQWAAPLTPAKFLALMKDQPFDFPVGERFLYRNTGYYFAGMIIEQMSGRAGATGGGGGAITGKPYGEFLRESFFAPLGMTSTVDCRNRPIIKRRSTGYTTENGVVMNIALLDLTWPFAVGSLCSTVTDLLRWSAALHGGRVLSAELYQKMTTAVTLNDGSKTEYGYGLRVSSLDGHRVLDHGGGMPGYSTHLAYYPDDRLTIVVLTNHDNGGAGPIHQQIARLVLGPPAASTR
jgi:CubicO group peptidase (beta-lactamase class C family)